MENQEIQGDAQKREVYYQKLEDLRQKSHILQKLNQLANSKSEEPLRPCPVLVDDFSGGENQSEDNSNQ